MVKTYNTMAFAKINIFLRVCGKYENGYHRLLMLMQEIDLGDEIIVEFDDEKEFEIELANNIEGLDPHKNLCYKAAAGFYDKYLRKLVLLGLDIDEAKATFQHIRITAIKNTPSEAGLGGGSSDAASILMIMSQHYGNPLSSEEMVELAASLGADVPFFLTGGSCFCEGIGEIVTEVPSLSGMHMVLVKPSLGVPTGKCFNLCDEYPEVFDEEMYRSKMEEIFTNDEITPIERIQMAKDLLTNDLQKPAMEITPRISDVKSIVDGTDPVFSMMSGSGSTVFAIYSDDKKAATALNSLKENESLSDCLIIPSITI